MYPPDHRETGHHRESLKWTKVGVLSGAVIGVLGVVITLVIAIVQSGTASVDASPQTPPATGAEPSATHEPPAEEGRFGYDAASDEPKDGGDPEPCLWRLHDLDDGELLPVAPDEDWPDTSRYELQYFMCADGNGRVEIPRDHFGRSFEPGEIADRDACAELGDSYLGGGWTFTGDEDSITTPESGVGLCLRSDGGSLYLLTFVELIDKTDRRSITIAYQKW